MSSAGVHKKASTMVNDWYNDKSTAQGTSVIKVIVHNITTEILDFVPLM